MEVGVCEFLSNKSCISTAAEFLKMCQNGTDA
jgi:hypothetical protein